MQNLLINLLEPSPQKRFTINEVEHSSWIFDDFDIQYQEIDRDWKIQKFEAYAKSLNCSVEKVVAEIREKPFGTLGGLYNVDKFLYRNEKFELVQRADSEEL